MKIISLLRYLSVEFHSSVALLDPGCVEPREIITGRHEFDGMAYIDNEIRKEIISGASEDMPLICTVSNILTYAVIASEDRIYLFGPVAFKSPLPCRFGYTTGNSIGDWREKVPFCDFMRFLRTIQMLQNLLNPGELDVNDILAANYIKIEDEEDVKRHFSRTLFENLENSMHHNPYDQEQREFSSIENGDLVLLEKSIAEDYTGQMGILADNYHRSMKNICIVVLTLASRAAIRGGVPPEISYSLSDSYIRKVETIASEERLGKMVRNAERHYTQLVKDYKGVSEGSDRTFHKKVTKSKQYINKHLLERITLKDVAAAVEINPSYLSVLFADCEKISISKYIIRQKIFLSRELLIYTDTPLIEVAASLGFASQSHYSTHFREICGMTPGKYRHMHAVLGDEL